MYFGGCVAFLVWIAHFCAERTYVNDHWPSIGVIVMMGFCLVLELHVGEAGL